MTRMGSGLGGRWGGGLRERAVLLALAKLHLPREDRRGDGHDAHYRERADDREEPLDGAEESTARVAIAHSSPSSRCRDRILSRVARSSFARPSRSVPAASRSF